MPIINHSIKLFQQANAAARQEHGEARLPVKNQLLADPNSSAEITLKFTGGSVSLRGPNNQPLTGSFVTGATSVQGIYTIFPAETPTKHMDQVTNSCNWVFDQMRKTKTGGKLLTNLEQQSHRASKLDVDYRVNRLGIKMPCDTIFTIFPVSSRQDTKLFFSPRPPTGSTLAFNGDNLDSNLASISLYNWNQIESQLDLDLTAKPRRLPDLFVHESVHMSRLMERFGAEPLAEDAQPPSKLTKKEEEVQTQRLASKIMFESDSSGKTNLTSLTYNDFCLPEFPPEADKDAVAMVYQGPQGSNSALYPLVLVQREHAEYLAKTLEGFVQKHDRKANLDEIQTWLLGSINKASYQKQLDRQVDRVIRLCDNKISMAKLDGSIRFVDVTGKPLATGALIGLADDKSTLMSQLLESTIALGGKLLEIQQNIHTNPIQSHIDSSPALAKDDSFWLSLPSSPFREEAKTCLKQFLQLKQDIIKELQQARVDWQADLTFNQGEIIVDIKTSVDAEPIGMSFDIIGGTINNPELAQSWKQHCNELQERANHFGVPDWNNVALTLLDPSPVSNILEILG